MKVLSVIIPAYNSAQYLEKCVASLLCTEISEKLEVIVVNDGSTDETEQIAQRICEQAPKTVRLISQENKGHGGALNTGTAAATGKYLKVIDADDWVETENLPEFIKKLEDIDSDVVLTHHYTIDITSGEVKKWKSSPEAFLKPLSFEDIVANWKNFDLSFTFHGITYNTEFYKKHATGLSEKVFYEDHEYSTFPACFAKTVTPIDMFIYDYRIGDVTQSVSDENQLKRISHSQRVMDKFVTEYNRVKDRLSASAQEFICLKAKILLLSILTTLLLVEKNKKQGRKQAADIVKVIKRQMPRVLELSGKQYKILLIMNRLHISRAVFNRLMAVKHKFD